MSCMCTFLCFFSSLLVHGVSPDRCNLSTVVPIPKGKNVCLSDLMFAYCYSLYGSVLWDLNSHHIESLSVDRLICIRPMTKKQVPHSASARLLVKY